VKDKYETESGRLIEGACARHSRCNQGLLRAAVIPTHAGAAMDGSEKKQHPDSA
jgi:hypothetical protein